MSQKFIFKNQGFTCQVCQTEVAPLETGCRNHCPRCLSSLHLDEFPGDRQSSCKAVMRATGYYFHKKKGLMLRFTCSQCGEQKVNKAALDDPKGSDDYDLILSLTPKT